MATVGLLCFLVVIFACEKSFVATAPSSFDRGTPEVVPETLDANVQQLESLKQSIGKSFELLKSQSASYLNHNGREEAHSTAQAEVKQDGRLLLRVAEHADGGGGGSEVLNGSRRIDIDIPGKDTRSVPLDIRPQWHHTKQQTSHQAHEQQEEQEQDARRAEEDVGGSAGAFATKYTPLDMAEYVFWTGDEKGVTLAIEEFLQAGFMTRDEAIIFLQKIKESLNYLQTRYSTQLRGNVITDGGGAKVERPTNAEELSRVRKAMEQQLDVIKKNINRDSQEREDYDELVNRLRVADSLYTEYSLEEIIYHLAKMMFAEGVARGSLEAQHGLEKFTAFLESEAAQGRISRTLEKRVLDVLIASLTDALSEADESGPQSARVDLQLGRSIAKQYRQP